MNNILLLLKIQSLSSFGINKAIHTKDKKQKRKLILFSILMLIAIIYVFFISFLYSSMLSIPFEKIRKLELLPAIMVTISSMIMFFTTINKTNGILFTYKDYDLIMSLPVKTSHIIASRIILLYLMNILLTCIIMLPAALVYAIKVAPSIAFYFFFILTFFFIPLIPIIIAVLIGTIFSIISSGFRHNNRIYLFLNLAFLLAFMVFSFNIENLSIDFAQLGDSIMLIVYRFYPITRMYIDSLCSTNIMSFLQFTVLSLFSFIVFVIILAKKYQTIHTALTTNRSRSNYTIGELKQTSIFQTLYIKELKRYFSSPLYVINTAIGSILLLLMAISLFIFGSDSLEQMLEMPGFSQLLYKIAPLITSAMVVLGCTTASSISLEGKNLWILKSSPIKSADIFLSKIAVNLTLPIPAILISTILLSIRLQFGLFDTFFLFITPLVYVVFISVLGLLINLKFPNMEWTSEITVVKQSASVLLAMLASFASIIPPFVAVFKTNINATLIVSLTTLIIMLLSIVFFQYLLKTGTKQLYEL